MAKIASVGAGAWGTTLAILLAQNKHTVTLWAYEKDFVPLSPLPANINITGSLKAALADTELVVFAVPTQFMRNIVKEAVQYLPKGVKILSAAKGIEIATLKRPSEIIKELAGNTIAVISGPNLAREIALSLPAASVVAANNPDLSQYVQTLFAACKTFRLYSSNDIVGVELGGALKNVIAIAAGALEAKKLGDNAKAALIVRGIAEITRLGVAMGARAETFSGLSGLGDLITTCQSKMSRNHMVGERLARGEKLNAIISSSKDVAEGIPTTQAAVNLSEKYKVEMPITREVYQVLFKGKSVNAALADLMDRPQKSEY